MPTPPRARVRFGRVGRACSGLLSQQDAQALDTPTAGASHRDARIAQASCDLVQLQPVAATLAKQSQFILFFGQQSQQSLSLSSVSWLKRYPVREASRGWPSSSLVRGGRSSVFFRVTIPLLQGWSIVTRGIGLTLTPPEGVACGAIGYDERRRPLRPIASLLAEASTFLRQEAGASAHARAGSAGPWLDGEIAQPSANRNPHADLGTDAEVHPRPLPGRGLRAHMAWPDVAISRLRTARISAPTHPARAGTGSALSPDPL